MTYFSESLRSLLLKLVIAAPLLGLGRGAFTAIRRSKT